MTTSPKYRWQLAEGPVITVGDAARIDFAAHDGGVWVGYTPPEELGERHNVPPDLLVNLRVVEALAAAAAASPTGR